MAPQYLQLVRFASRLGWNQKVAFSVALLFTIPKIIFLDEPQESQTHYQNGQLLGMIYREANKGVTIYCDQTHYMDRRPNIDDRVIPL